MTTNAAHRQPTTHAFCSHPVTKAARAKCRKERGADYATARVARATVKQPVVIEPCSCKGKPSGFTFNPEKDYWVCADCDRPTKGYLMNALGALLAA